MSRPLAIFIASGSVVAITLLLGYFALVPQKGGWVSRKGVARNFGDTGFFSAAETPIPRRCRAPRRSDIVREVKDGRITFSWEESNHDREEGEGSLQIIRIPRRFTANESQVVDLPGGGCIRLGWARMGYNPRLDPLPVRPSFRPTDLTVRGDTWKAISIEELLRYQTTELGLAKGVNYGLSKALPEGSAHGSFSLDLHFIHEGLPDCRSASGIELMNLDTRTRSGSGHFNQSNPGHLHGCTLAKALYPARIAAAFDIAYGPCEVARVPLRPGSVLSLPTLEMEIISIESSTAAWRSGFHNGVARRSIAEPRSGEKVSTCVFFSISSPSLGRFCDLVLVNRDGQEETINLRDCDPIEHVTTDSPPDELAEIEVRYRPNHARLVFELPPLQGTPGVNNDIDDLLDVTIPHFKAKSGSHLQELIESHAAIRFDVDMSGCFEGNFPRYFENRTVRQFLEDGLGRHPERERMRFDRKTHRVFLRKRPNWRQRWNNLKLKLGW